MDCALTGHEAIDATQRCHSWGLMVVGLQGCAEGDNSDAFLTVLVLIVGNNGVKRGAPKSIRRNIASCMKLPLLTTI